MQFIYYYFQNPYSGIMHSKFIHQRVCLTGSIIYNLHIYFRDFRGRTLRQDPLLEGAGFVAGNNKGQITWII